MLDGLSLQSGSFFPPRYERHEGRFRYYRRIVGFVGQARDGGLAGRPVPVGLTCGAIEENAPNNRLMAWTLRAQGYLAELDEVADGHNYTAWRGALDPHPTPVLCRACP